MTNEYVIVTDSSCDLPPEMAQELGLIVLPLTVALEGKEYANYLDGREIGFKDFYDRIRSGAVGTTSAANVEGFMGAMEPSLARGRTSSAWSFPPGSAAPTRPR